MDNDAVVEDATLTELVKVAESDPKVAAVGAKAYYYEQRQKIWNFGGRIDWVRGKFFDTEQNEFNRESFKTEKETDTFPIGFGITRTDVIKKAGKIDERYFIYYEETDWHIRMKRLGYKLMVTSKARIWHKVSSSLGKESAAFYYYRTRNRLLFMYKNAPKIKFCLFMLYFLYDFTYNTWLTLYLSRRPKECRAALWGIIDFLRGKSGKRILNDDYLSEPISKIFLAKSARHAKNLLINIVFRLLYIPVWPWHLFKRLKFRYFKGKLNEILIIYLAEGLGDCILLSGVLPAIREKFKDAKINLLVFERFKEYFQDDPYVDRLFTYSDYRYAKYGFRKFLAYSRCIRKQCLPDILIDLLPNRFIKPAIFSGFIPKKLSIGFDYSIKRLFYDISVKINWNKYFYDLFFDVLKPLEISKKEPQYWVPQSVPEPVLSIEKNSQYKTIILATGGKYNLLKSKDYGGFKYYPELVTRLVNEGYQVILVGAEYDMDLQSITNDIPGDRFVNLLGKTSLPQLFSLVKEHADLVICNTSGLLYVALAVGIPAVFYAHPLENLSRWHPSPNNGRYLALRDNNQRQVSVNDFLGAVSKCLLRNSSCTDQNGENFTYKSAV